MMLYGSYVTTLHPASIASFLLTYALFIAASSTVTAGIIKKCGRHFFLNCKHCILGKGKNLAPDQEIDIMNDITVVQDLLINRWASQSSYAVTEVVAILCILFFDASLFGYACLLFVISKLLSTCEDWVQLREQDHFNKINFQKEQDISMDEEISWYKNALAGHNFITLTYAAYSHFMPVLFLYIALTACIESPDGDALPLSKAMSSSVFFFVTCYSALKQHGNTEYMIKNCFHGYKVIKFDKDSGGYVFTKEAIATYQEDRPKVTCSPSGIRKMSMMDILGYGFTAVVILGLVITFSLVVKAGFDVTNGEAADGSGGSSEPLGANTAAAAGNSFCNDVFITCSHVPDDGSYSTFTTGTHFSVTEGCTLETSASDLLRRCADDFVALENEDAEEIEVTYEDDESDDVAAAEAAIQDIGAEALATPTASNTNVGGSVVIAASYTNWKNSKHTFHQVFTVDGVADSDISEGGRRRRNLSGATEAAVSSSGEPSSSNYIDDTEVLLASGHQLTFTVGTGR
jgi:hypothetical protein